MSIILVENQKFIIKWHNQTKRHYVEKGYIFTGKGKEFEVAAEDLSPGSNIMVKCICDYCGKEFDVRYIHYVEQMKSGVEKYACKDCSQLKKIEKNSKGLYSKNKGVTVKYSTQKVIDIVESKNNNKVLNPEEYINLDMKNLKIICGSCGKEFISSLNNLRVSGGRCHECGVKACGLSGRKYTKEYVENYINSINNNKLLNPLDYQTSELKNLRVQCGECGNEYFVSFYNYKFLNQTCCPKCSTKKVWENNKYTPDEVKEIINSKNGNVVLNSEEYIGCLEDNLKIKCGDCGNTFITSLRSYMSGKIRCNSCSKAKSVGERIMEDILTKLEIDFISQKRFDDCRDKRPLPFDCYLPNYNYCLEFDGQQHFEPKFGKKSFESTQKHDKIKNEYCESHGIGLLRIPYWEASNMEEIIKNTLNI